MRTPQEIVDLLGLNEWSNNDLALLRKTIDHVTAKRCPNLNLTYTQGIDGRMYRITFQNPAIRRDGFRLTCGDVDIESCSCPAFEVRNDYNAKFFLRGMMHNRDGDTFLVPTHWVTRFESAIQALNAKLFPTTEEFNAREE